MCPCENLLESERRSCFCLNQRRDCPACWIGRKLKIHESECKCSCTAQGKSQGSPGYLQFSRRKRRGQKEMAKPTTECVKKLERPRPGTGNVHTTAERLRTQTRHLLRLLLRPRPDKREERHEMRTGPINGSSTQLVGTD